MPRIIVRSEPTTLGEVKDVTADNVMTYAEEVAKALEAEKKPQEESSAAGLRRQRLGPLRKKAKFSGRDVEWQVLQTVHDGRTYYVDLQVLAGQLATETDKRDAAYAVAATMKFLEPASGSPAAE